MPEELARAAREVRDEVHALRPVMEAHRLQLVKANRRSKIGVVVGIFGVAVGAVALLAVYLAVQVANDRANDTVQARESACLQYNEQRREIRATFKATLLKLVPPDTVLTDAQKATVDRYGEEVDLRLPFRDCSPAGLDAYYKNPPK